MRRHIDVINRGHKTSLRRFFDNFKITLRRRFDHFKMSTKTSQEF